LDATGAEIMKPMPSLSADHEPLSIAAEVALLFLSELEPKIADDPELLVSTEAILSFATIRRALPAQWERWKAILAKYQKSDLIEYMLCEPASIDGGDWQSKAAKLVALSLKSGIELFHDPDQRGWASVRIDQHWENYPLRSRTFQLYLLRNYYTDTGENPG